MMRVVLRVLTIGVAVPLVPLLPRIDAAGPHPDACTLAAATYPGGRGADGGYEVSIVVAPDTSICVTGLTASTDFPTTPSAYDTTFNGGGTDRFVSRFAGLSRLAASTYVGSKGAVAGSIGRNGDDLGHGIAIDRAGNVFVAAYTESPDYLVTAAAFDSVLLAAFALFAVVFDRMWRRLPGDSLAVHPVNT